MDWMTYSLHETDVQFDSTVPQIGGLYGVKHVDTNPPYQASWDLALPWPLYNISTSAAHFNSD